MLVSSVSSASSISLVSLVSLVKSSSINSIFSSSSSSFNELPITLENFSNIKSSVIIIEWLMRYWENSTEKKISLNRLSKSQYEQKQKEKNINQPSELRFYTYKIMEMMSKVIELQPPKNKLLFNTSGNNSTEICTFFDSTRIYSFDSLCLEQLSTTELEEEVDKIEQDNVPRLTCN